MSAFVGNEVTAGVRFPDQGGPGQVGGIGQGWGDPVGGGSFIVMDTWSALNRLIVFKGNKVHPVHVLLVFCPKRTLNCNYMIALFYLTRFC